MGKDPNERPNGRKREGTGKRFTEGFLGFVDIPLSDADRVEIAAQVEQGKYLVPEFLDMACSEGYKFSLSNDAEHNSCIATLTGKGPNNPNKGYALSARGPDPLSAIVVLWYKVSVLREWGSWVGENGEGPQQIPMFR